ncbi:MAG TPA: 5-formyltetrahydrofolate cyclo-ligase [Rhizomicrobium sp.]|jgi:5-formyltetrahydrofolate cyclo-ligase
MTSKTLLRTEARARREKLARAIPDFAARVAAHADALGIADGSVVGGYAALQHEADPRQLLEALAQKGCEIGLPRVDAKDAPLVFHARHLAQTLRKGTYGIQEPHADWPVVRPCVLLVPLLAFDAHGHRLGYGGGFYDRTIASLGKPLRTIGVAYAGQEVRELPHEPHDHPLDAVITENGMRHFQR